MALGAPLADIVIRIKATADDVKAGIAQAQSLIAAMAANANAVVASGKAASASVASIGSAAKSAGAQAAAGMGGVGAAAAQAGTAVVGASGAFTGLRNVIARIGEIAAGIGLYELFVRALGAVQEMVQTGVQFNSQLELMQLGMKSIVSANTLITDETGKQIEGVDRLRAVQGLVAEQIEKLKVDAIVTTSTFQQLVEAFSVAIGPGLAAGLGLDQIRQLTTAFAQLAGAIGLPTFQLPIEVREILGGTISGARTRLAQVLQIDNETISRWKEQGRLFEELRTRLAPFIDAGRLAGDTWSGVTSTMQDLKEQILGIVIAPAQEFLRQRFLAIRDSLIETRGGVITFREGVASAMQTAAATVAATVQAFFALVDSIKQIGTVVIGAGSAIAELATIIFTLGGLLQPVEALLFALVALSPFIAVLIGFVATSLGPFGLVAVAIGAIVAALTGWNFYQRQVGDALQQSLQPAIDLQNASENREKQIRAEVSALESELALMTSGTASRVQQRQSIERLGASYGEFLPFLVDENKNMADAVPLIRDLVAARKRAADEQQKIQLDALRRQEAGRRGALEAARAALEELGVGELEGAGEGGIRTRRTLTEFETGTTTEFLETAEESRRRIAAARVAYGKAAEEAREATAKRQALEDAIAGRITIKPRPPVEDEKVTRKRELEERKAGLQEILDAERSALEELKNREAIFKQTGVFVPADFEQMASGWIEFNGKRIDVAKQTAEDAREVDFIEFNGRRIEFERFKDTRTAAEREMAEQLAREQQALPSADDAVFRARMARAAEFLADKQEIERNILAATIENLRTEEALARARPEPEARAEAIRLSRERAEKEAEFQRKLMDQEKERALFAKDILDERRKDEEALFQFRKSMGEVSLEEEIARQRAIVAVAREGSKQQRDALVAIRDLEKKLQAERESEALGRLAELKERLKKGALEGFTEGTRLTPETLPAALEALERERSRRIEELRSKFAGVGLSPEELRELIELQRKAREGSEKARPLGGIPGIAEGAVGLPPSVGLAEDLRRQVEAGLISREEAERILAEQLGREAPSLAPAAGLVPTTGEAFKPFADTLEQLPQKADKAFADIRGAFADTNIQLMEEARQFREGFPRALYEGFYQRLVQQLQEEFARG